MTPAELKKLIDLYITGDATPEEKQLVDDWYISYTETQNADNISNDELLKAEIYAGIANKINKPVAKTRSINFMRYAAAVAIIVVSASVLIRKKNILPLFSEKSTENFTAVTTRAGEVKQVNLPDGSSVWLNANSVLRISSNFQDKQQRYVYLDEGEAFFKVTKNPERPFLVKTPHITTRVLGTSFNVRAYRALQQSSVTVCTGRVQVNDSKRQLAVLIPNTQVNYDVASGSAKVIKADGLASRIWTEGKLMLNNATFNDLAFAITNTYGIKLVSKNNASKNYRFNININTQRTLDETLRIICSVHQNTYRRKADEIAIY
jgi:transmembrane sensor